MNNGEEWVIQDSILHGPNFLVNTLDTASMETFEEILASGNYETMTYDFICPVTISDSCLILFHPKEYLCDNGITEIFSISNSSSLRQVSKIITNEIEIFPNPARSEEYLNIRAVSPSSYDEVQVLSVTGRVLKAVKSDSSRIPLSGFSNGIYFVRLLKDKYVISIQKLILTQ
ncbi:T9SS type A sorting domain-containing protein [Portibacter lacus]|nr:T9SS type A sorting domain-containing protein [Portibacter lacus]